MSVFDEPKIDAHCHIFDPVRFPYAPDVAYRPGGQEIGTCAQYLRVMDAYGIRHALLVGPNSGYSLDNRCMLDAIARSGDRFRGIAVMRNDATREDLLRLREAGVIGVAFNATVLGVEYYLGAGPLLTLLAELGMFVQVQVERDQLVALAPLLGNSGARILIDHGGRPDPGAGLEQPGFQALLALGRTGRAAVIAKRLRQRRRGKAPQRLDMGPLIRQVERLLPDAADRSRLWWETPRRWLGFPAHSA